MPPRAYVERLSRVTAALIDRRQSPGDHSHRFAGVAGSLLAGHPAVGGFGALPWQEHVHARRAVWASRLFTSTDLQWAEVGRLLLMQWWGGPGKAYSPLVHLVGTGQQRVWPSTFALPHPLQRLLDGVAALPPVPPLSPTALPAGVWRASIPLFANPVLAHAGPDGRLQGLDAPQHHLLRVHARMQCVGHVLSFAHVLHGLPLPAVLEQRVRQQLQPAVALFPSMAALQQTVDNVVAQLPPDVLPPVGWLSATASHVPPVEAAAKVLMQLAWPVPGGASHIPLATLTVKAATALQLLPVTTQRLDRHAAFIQEALGGMPVGTSDRAQFRSTLSALWRVRWNNHYKEIYWRLVVDGLPTAQRMHIGVACLRGMHFRHGMCHFVDPCRQVATSMHPCRHRNIYSCIIIYSITYHTSLLSID